MARSTSRLPSLSLMVSRLSPLEISELAYEVDMTTFESDGLDKATLAAKLEAASFADLVAIVESLGF